ncbi:MAG TPA: hypothetical protein VM406_16395 [Noviherbaspirillum sp.]|nr:hypothetical protein [Noviherbaspirillum sp.]
MNDLTSERTDTAISRGFNFNKLQAALCIASSSAVSLGLIYLAVTRLF